MVEYLSFVYECCWSSCRNSKCKFYANFFSNNKLLSITRKKKKKHDKVLILAKSKINSIETLISHALIDMDISHGEFIAIFKEKYKHEEMKENLRFKNEKQKIMRLISIK